ncbi:three component ABC system middle component [Jiangella muralis]|uniref:three component ABC system middle component n=1 Tax=Jiangella muralis TaxID=702383 RepID=UPI00069FD57A|nr:three component ABC system middle component [Jiangella muralis]
MTADASPVTIHSQLPGWDQRSPVPAAMFNPALVAVTIATAANQYEETAGFPMPWPLAHLVTPLVLHRPTREALPRTKATSLTKWAGDNAVLIAGFPARANQMAPYVREGLRFGLREGTVELVDGDGLRSLAEPQIQPRKAAGDLPVVYRASGMIGRVFGRAGNAASIYSALGVQP